QVTAQRGAVLGATNQSGQSAVANFDFESGTNNFVIDNTPPSGAATGLWHHSTGRGAQTGHTATHSFSYGSGEGANGGGTYSTSSQRNTGKLTSPATLIPAGAQLTFNYILQTESLTNYDTAEVQISTNGFASYSTVASRTTNLPNVSSWTAVAAIDLSSFAGQTAQIRWVFDTLDGVGNTYEGWYVDDVQITAPTTGYDYYAVSLAVGE